MRPTAKKLILGLLLATDGRPLSVRAVISACALFDITDNNVRVTLVRLSAEGLIESAGRGAYVLGPAAAGTADEVAHWREAASQLRPWEGRYAAVIVPPLAKSARRQQRQRERMLGMLGMRALEADFYLRPDNLQGGVAAVRARLQTLGLDTAIPVFSAGDFSPADNARLEGLWDCAALNRRYQRQTRRLQDWLSRCDDLETDVAARESYLIGAEAIRDLVFDPWLPEEMIDAPARQAYLATVRQFDETGKAIWNRLHLSDHAMSVADAVQQSHPVDWQQARPEQRN